MSKVVYVCRNEQNRAGVRLLMACLLAKIHRPDVDVRKPYTEIGDVDAFSSRTYDEHYIARFVNEHALPCNSTTAFLTPALRNRNTTLTPDVNLVGRPAQLYQAALDLLADVHEVRIAAETVLIAIVRCLLTARDEQKARLEKLLTELHEADDIIPLSAEGIVHLIHSQMELTRSSRLPVLIVAAAYQAAATHLGEKALPLHAHNAADRQTRAIGDIELSLITDDEIIASYEMKDKPITQLDIDAAVTKVTSYARERNRTIGHYIFVTTKAIDREVADYAANLYTRTGGIEFVILDCLGFLRHFLHLFYRLRLHFLDAFQELLLAEPSSAVSDALKGSFLAARRAAESITEEP